MTAAGSSSSRALRSRFRRHRRWKRRCLPPVCGEAIPKRGRHAWSPGDVLYGTASDGTFISIDDEEAKQFRESVVEWLMTNHPHDCPVCEEGGHSPSSGYDRDDRTQLPLLPFHQNVPTVSGSGAVHLSRNEPLHRLLPLRHYKDYADEIGRLWRARQRLSSVARKTARWKANFPVTWSKSALSAYLPRNPLRALQP